MKSLLRVGTKEQHESYVGPERTLSIDSDTKILKLHDGVTPGGKPLHGFENLPPHDGKTYILKGNRWVREENMRNPPGTGPGPQELIYGDEELGYFGEVSAPEFFSYSDLAAEVSLTQGTNTWPDDTWFKFYRKGKVLYIPRMPVRQSITWQELFNRGLVYGTDIDFNGDTFIIRLIRGTSNENPTTNEYRVITNISTETINSEWDDLYTLVSEITYPTQKMPNVENYSESFLRISNRVSGSSAPTQETSPSNDALFRGFESVLHAITRPKGTTDTGRGWRPILEYVSDR